MNKRDEEFFKKLLATFKIEADEHIKNITTGLLALEKTPDDEKQIAIIETIYREAHSLKGASRAVNLNDIVSICQSLESVFAALKHKEISASSRLFDTLHNALDIIDKLLTPAEGKDFPQISELIQQMEGLKAGGSENEIQPIDKPPTPLEEEVPQTQSIPTAQTDTIVADSQPQEGSKTKPEQQVPKSEIQKQDVSKSRTEDSSNIETPITKEGIALKETVRISKVKLGSILVQAEELLSVKMTEDQRIVELQNVINNISLYTKKLAKIETEIRQNKKSQSFNMQEFLVWNRTSVKTLEGSIKALTKSAKINYRLHSGMVDDLLTDVKTAMMLPFSSLMESFPKMVRDISRHQGKDVDMVIKGGEIEIDRRILDEMKDPLIHLLRNCLDHGIEKPEERKRKKKPPRGLITVTISQVSGGKVEILVVDDGVGIDVAKVREVAVKREVLSEEEADKLNEKEALLLIFLSEVSTSPIITDLSGRGLGLSIVREKTEELGGFVSVETALGIGATFRLILPLTIATFRGILVKVAEQTFVVPIVNVERVTRIIKEDIKTVENRETIKYEGRTVSFVRLGDILDITCKEENGGGNGYVSVLILNTLEKFIALSVDEVQCEQEVLVKSLGRQLSRVRNISNAAVLGSGKVIAILNVNDIVKSASNPARSKTIVSVATDEDKVKEISVLIVEDSITSRMLLKNILESAGYNVKVTVDGVDAYTTLREGAFDLVVSDVEMPRMNGFELTSRIRSDKKYSEIPIILVTALESREDRERGIDVGANAYIVKSSFDQSNLLKTIQRLI